MAISIVKKIISVIMVLELLIMATATSRINGGHNEKFSFSPTCILLCGAECKDKGILTPICFVKCLFNCKMTPAVSDDIRVCTSNCAQSTCSKFIEGNQQILL